MLRADHEINPKLELRALRNWNITILDDELGFDLAKIARRVGHSHQRNASTAMTSHYSLRDRKVDAEMAAGVAAYLEKLDALAPQLHHANETTEVVRAPSLARPRSKSAATRDVGS